MRLLLEHQGLPASHSVVQYAHLKARCEVVIKMPFAMSVQVQLSGLEHWDTSGVQGLLFFFLFFFFSRRSQELMHVRFGEIHVHFEVER